MQPGFGAVIWRKARQSQLEIALFHDAERDEWTLPTGRSFAVEATADDIVAFLQRSTGLLCKAGSPLAPIRCAQLGRPARLVRFWAMSAVGGTFQANATFDKAWWLLEHEIAAVAGHAYDVVAARAASRGLHAEAWRCRSAVNA